MTTSTSESSSISDRHRAPDQALPTRIAAIQPATPSASVLWLEYGEQPLRYQPGQWIDLGIELDGRWQVGGYSITSTARTPGRVRIAVKEARRHPVSRWLRHGARIGDRVWISHGQGDFYYRPAHGERLIHLAAGIGITPIMGIIRHVVETRPEVSQTLVYGASHAHEFLFREELETLAREHPGLRCLFVPSRPHAGWNGPRGPLLDVLERECGLHSTASYYFCGPPGFVDDTQARLIARGVDPARLVFERWW